MSDGSETHISVQATEPQPAAGDLRAPGTRRTDCAALRCTGGDPTQTFLELAAGRTQLVDLVVAGDGLVRARATTPDELIRLLTATSDRGHGWAPSRSAGARGCRLGARIAASVAGRARRFPEPLVKHILASSDGRGERRLDLSYPAIKLITEYDGR